jgi:protein SCO1/2
MRGLIAMLALAGCNFVAGDTYTVHGVVRDVGERSVKLEHGAVPGVFAEGDTTFVVDPNLARQLRPGDLVQANLMTADDGTVRIIGAKVTGHEEPLALPPGAVIALAEGEQLPALTMPGVDGPVTIGAGQGVPTVLTFLFTSCPMPEACPLLASKLKELQGQLGQARIVSVTLDPARDSLEVLKAYGAERGADPAQWTFARLELDELKTLLLRAGASRVESQGDILHSLHILVLDADGRLIWRGSDNSWDVAEVAAWVNRGPGG